MTVFTKDHPFEFEGVKVRRDAAGLKYSWGEEYVIEARVEAALIAFIEAENAVWRWVEEGKVARKGRWTGRRNRGGTFALRHDDFHETAWWSRPDANDGSSRDVRAAWDSFISWLAAQSQPTEPTTFGYVGTVTDSDGDVWDVIRDNDRLLAYLVTRRTDGRFQVRAWSGVLALGTFEPKGDGR